MSTNQVSNRSLGADEGAGWKGISTAPSYRDLELAVIDRGELHALVFPCRLLAMGRRLTGRLRVMGHTA